MDEAHGNKTKAAELVGLPSYQTLTNWLARYQVEKWWHEAVLRHYCQLTRDRRMSRNETQTCRELIEPALRQAGWELRSAARIGTGTGQSDRRATCTTSTQRIVVDYLLRLGPLPLAVLEAKAEAEAAADGMQQGSRYANRLGVRFSIASNGAEHILTDNQTGTFETLD